MGRRLTVFDYSRPYFYMVTMKCCKGIAVLSEVVEPGRLRGRSSIAFAISMKLVKTIAKNFEELLG